MIINNIKLQNYRNHINLELDFDPKTNLIIGQNGIGKTNILEAIHLLAVTKSFRAKYDKDLINYESKFASISGKVQRGGHTDQLQIQVFLL